MATAGAAAYPALAYPALAYPAIAGAAAYPLAYPAYPATAGGGSITDGLNSGSDDGVVLDGNVLLGDLGKGLLDGDVLLLVDGLLDNGVLADWGQQRARIHRRLVGRRWAWRRGGS